MCTATVWVYCTTYTGGRGSGGEGSLRGQLSMQGARGWLGGSAVLVVAVAVGAAGARAHQGAQGCAEPTSGVDEAEQGAEGGIRVEERGEVSTGEAEGG